MKQYTQYPEIAIALRYDGKDAPRVMAKGEGEVADQICRLAEQHDVPMYPQRELALVLSKVELGEQVPEALYRAVAEVIAFAYLLADRLSPLPMAGDAVPALPRLDTDTGDDAAD